MQGSTAIMMSDDAWGLLSECWTVTPEKRPTAEQVVTRLTTEPLKYIPDGHDVTPVRRIRRDPSTASM